ncbi:MAG: riboflavin synthase [Terriglobia bacterium]
MFSGIVQTTSPILEIEESPQQRIIWIRTPKGWRLGEGESVCVEGVCSTVQRTNRGNFQVIYMAESLRRSTLGSLSPRCPVNLERSVALGDLLGGHLVEGHVDGTARILKVQPEGDAAMYHFGISSRSTRYLVEKGSVAVDGISLTVVKVQRARFTASVLSYTRSRTTLGRKGPGDRVNIEFDILAKYVEKLLAR